MGRTIIEGDSLPWMSAHPAHGSVVTSLPDVDESGMDYPSWREWFMRAAGLAMLVAKPSAPAIFYQTDRKRDGALISKPELLFIAADRNGLRLLWHKVAMRRDEGKVDIHRPGFCHLLAFSLEGRPGAATPDVFDRGRTVYPNGMGLNAAALAVRFAGKAAEPVVDPFCGRGTVPAVAEALGFSAIGVDIDPAQARAATALRLRLNGEVR
jgi:hypothetical protein